MAANCHQGIFKTASFSIRPFWHSFFFFLCMMNRALWAQVAFNAFLTQVSFTDFQTKEAWGITLLLELNGNRRTHIVDFHLGF